jgi:hypothetical protein
MDGGGAPPRKTRMAPDKTRMSFVLPVVFRAWLHEESHRLGATSSDVVRGAIALLRSQPPHVRGAVVDAEREGGTPLERVEAP